MTETDAWLSRYHEEQRLRCVLQASATAHNKAALFDLLEETAIATAVADFDGYGDSGQIERIAFLAADSDEQSAPTGTIAFQTVRHNGSGIDREDVAAAEAVEKFAYMLLEQSHDGWEINEGAFGGFTFDVAGRTIQLAYNERIETSEFHEHVW